jgi:hypothetical protein
MRGQGTLTCTATKQSTFFSVSVIKIQMNCTTSEPDYTRAIIFSGMAWTVADAGSRQVNVNAILFAIPQARGRDVLDLEQKISSASDLKPIALFMSKVIYHMPVVIYLMRPFLNALQFSPDLFIVSPLFLEAVLTTTSPRSTERRHVDDDLSR